MADISEDLQDRIEAYIDGQLDPAEAARLEVFLANTNPALADRVIGMIADKKRMHLLPRPGAPGDLSARIMEQVERASLLENVEQFSAPHRRWWQSRAAIAAGIVVLLGGFTYFILSSVMRSGNPYEQMVARHEAPPAAAPLAAASPDRADGGGVGGSEALLDRAKSVAEADAMKALPAMSKSAESAAGGKEAAAAQSPARGNASADRELASPIASAGPTAAAQQTVAHAAETVQEKSVVAAGPAIAQANQAQSAETQIASAAGANAPAGTAFGGSASGGRTGGGGGGRGGRGEPSAGGFGGGGRSAQGTGSDVSGGFGGTVAAAPAAALAEALPTTRIAPAGESPGQALAVLSRQSVNSPLILTILARDNQDYVRLSAALESYGIADGRGQGPARIVQEAAPAAQTLVANATGENKTATGVQANSLKDSLPPNPGNPNQMLQNGGSNWGNSSQVYQNTITDNRRDALPSSLMTANTANGGALSAPQNASPPLAYRVALRHDQLEDLAKQFHVAMVARGDNAYLFQVAGDKSPSTADASVRNDLARRAGFNEQAAPTARAALTIPPAAADDLKQQSAPATTPAAVPPASPLIDCIITIEPASPSAGAGQNSKLP